MADRRSIRAAADEGSGLPGLQDERPTRRDMMLSMAGALGFAALAQVQVAKPPSSEDVPGLVHYTVPPDLAAKYPPIPSWKRELKQLTPNVYAYIQPGGPGIDNHAIANAGVIVRPGDLMAIDALAAPLHTKLFIAEATKATHKNFRRLVNTHPHSDHVFGNQFFDPPIEIVAQTFCRESVLRMTPQSPTWPKREGWSDGTEVRTIVPPGTTYDTRMTYYYGDHGDLQVDLIFPGPAHTFGDTMVYLPQERILFTGDVVVHYVEPAMGSGNPSNWIKVLDKIMAMDVDTIVPGHGPIGNKENLALMREYLVLITSEARKRYDAGMSPGQAAADIDLGKFDVWPQNRDRTPGNVTRLYEEFSGTLQPYPEPGAAAKATAEYNAIKKAQTNQ
jgi:cyclase